jgi:hypothetical protein
MSNELAKENSNVVPAHIAALARKYEANAGLEGIDQTDLKLPFFRIVQPTSKELIPGGERYLPSARVGQIIEGAISRELMSELKVVPICVTKGYSEFRKQNDGGGFEGFHLDDSDRVASGIDNGDFNQLDTPEGTILKRTFQMFVLIDPVAKGKPKLGVMSFSGGGATEMKKFLSYTAGLDVPLFSKIYTITTFPKTNTQHNSTTFRPTFNVDESAWTPDDIAKAAGLLYEQLDGQRMKAILDATVEEDTPSDESAADVAAAVEASQR